MYLSILNNFGIDYHNGLHRCMDDEGLYRKVLSIFLDDDVIVRAQAAYQSKDYQKLFCCMHELKGSSGNAGMTKLYDAVVPLVEALRAEKYSDDYIDNQFKKITSAYNMAMEGIAEFLSKS